MHGTGRSRISWAIEIRTAEWENLKERARVSEGGIYSAVSGREERWGSGTSLRRPRRSGDGDAG